MLTRNMVFVQKAISLGGIALVCATSYMISFFNLTRMGAFWILGGMLLLLFALSVRYALAGTGQISRSYRMSLCRWRTVLFDFVTVAAPALIGMSFLFVAGLLLLVK